MVSRAAVGGLLGVVVLVVLAACSSSDSSGLTLPPATQSQPPTTSIVEPDPTSTTASVDEEAIDVWVELVTAAADRAETDRNADLIAGLTTPEVDEILSSVFIGEFPREVTSNAVGRRTGDAVTIDDCVILQPGITDSSTVWLAGEVGPGPDGGLIVARFEVETITGCAPASLAEEILTDYATYWDSRDAYFNPPDPSAPELEATTTSDHRDLNLDLAQRFLADGHVLRGRAEIHPEINQIRSPTEVLIVDCQSTDPERGVYDAATGERTDLIPAINADQRDGLEVTMRLENDVWKVADVQAARGIECELAPTPLGLPVVPPAEEIQ